MLIKLYHFIFYLIVWPSVLLQLVSSNGKESEECKLWSHVQDVFSESDTGLRCVKNVQCTGINCTGSFESFQFKTGLWLEACTDPVKAVLLLDIPELSLKEWSHEFSDGDKVPIPGAKINGPEGGELYLKLAIKKTTNSKYVSIAINLLLRIQFGVYERWTDIRNTIGPTEVPIPKCVNGKPVTQLTTTTTTTPSHLTTKSISPDQSGSANATNGTVPQISRPCNTKKLFFCGPHSTCKQLYQNSLVGECVCVDDYVFDKYSNKCVDPSSFIDKPKSAENQKSNETNYVIIISTVIPIVALLFCALMAFLSVRFRWWQRVRSRFQVRVYDQILIGGPQDAEDDDPVA